MGIWDMENLRFIFYFYYSTHDALSLPPLAWAGGNGSPTPFGRPYPPQDALLTIPHLLL